MGIFNLSQNIICACCNETLRWVCWLCVGTGTGGDGDPPRLQPGTLGGKYTPTSQSVSDEPTDDTCEIVVY